MEYFKSEFTQEILDYVRGQYGSELEFLWENSPDCAVLRHDTNKKWYAVFMNISKSKLGLRSDEKIDIAVTKCGPLISGSLRDNVGIFRGYHMNKENWITILLDGTVPVEQVAQLIDLSFEITLKK